jgi:hypothetical protein
MTFKNYIQEAIIVPKKLNIKTTDVDKLNSQFAGTILDFVEVDDINATGGGYRPELDEIEIRVFPGMDLNTLEALVNHEIIHSIQDEKSGMRMQAELEKEQAARKEIEKQIAKTDKNNPKAKQLIKDLSNWQTKHNFGTHEEKMAYAYMFVKMSNKNKIKNVSDVIRNAEDWLEFKIDKQFKKYIGMYWMVRKDL